MEGMFHALDRASPEQQVGTFVACVVTFVALDVLREQLLLSVAGAAAPAVFMAYWIQQHPQETASVGLRSSSPAWTPPPPPINNSPSALPLATIINIPAIEAATSDDQSTRAMLIETGIHFLPIANEKTRKIDWNRFLDSALPSASLDSLLARLCSEGETGVNCARRQTLFACNRYTGYSSARDALRKMFETGSRELTIYTTQKQFDYKLLHEIDLASTFYEAQPWATLTVPGEIVALFR